MAGFEFIKPLRTTYFSFRSVHDCPFTTVFTTIRDHFPGFALHSLTHYLSEAATRRYIFFADFEPPPTRKQEIGKKIADRLFSQVIGSDLFDSNTLPIPLLRN